MENFIEQCLEELGIPYYCGMPDFFAGEEPESYIVYSYYDIPECYADNEETETSYFVTVNIFSEKANEQLYNRVKRKLKDFGFVYQGGNSVNIDGAYPSRVRKIQEYIIN